MSALAVATGSVNLGQGFPDTDGPPEVSEAAVSAIRAGHNQYPPGRGIPELLDAIAVHQEHWYGLKFDPNTEVLVTAGATEAIAASILSLCEVGDEVVFFEPYYDSYAACVAMAGANRRVVPLRPPAWSFDPEDLQGALSERTRLLLINSPHNPTGKVFNREELESISRICVERDLIAVTDEVYEHLIFEGEHVPLASLPGMRERTVTISSAGKTFSFTGWKVGWACGPAPLIDAVRTAKQFLTYVNGAPFQHAVVTGLGLPDDRIRQLAVDLRVRRDILCSGLERLGFDVIQPAGTYFVTSDVGRSGEKDGFAFCRSLPDRCRVVAIPSGAFYDDQRAGAPFVRWTFCKQPEMLEEALRRLEALVE